MLEIIEYGKDEYGFPALLVLGCFDAIHAGHRDLLKKAKLQAKINGLDLGVMMFREGKNGKLVYSFEERCALLEQYNVKFVLAVDFNDEFKNIAPLDFLSAVEDKVNVKAYMSGKDFRFGAGAKGKSSTLKNYAEDEENGVWYMPVKDVDLNGEKISTTLIKSCLDDGNVAKANELLGAEFTVSGEVVKGEGRGTSVVGFPTVNIVYPEWKHPLKHGVYNVKCLIGETDYQGIANFGNCPTFGDNRIALEVYLEGYSGDLYGQVLTIRFIGFIRDIEEFGSAEELSGQLQSDLLSVSDELAAATDEQPVETVEEVVEEVIEEAVTEEVAEQPEEVVAEEAIVEEVVEQPEEVVIEEVVTEEIADDGFDDDAEVTETEEADETADIDITVEAEEATETEQPVVIEETADEEAPSVENVEVEEETADVAEEVSDEASEEIPEEVKEETPEQTVIEGVADDMQYSEGEVITENATVEEPDIEETENMQEDDGEQLDFIDEVVAEPEEVPVADEQTEQIEEAEIEAEVDEAETENSETGDGESD